MGIFSRSYVKKRCKLITHTNSSGQTCWPLKILPLSSSTPRDCLPNCGWFTLELFYWLNDDDGYATFNLKHFFLVLWPVCDALSSLFSMMLQTSVHRTKTNIGVTEIMTVTAISRFPFICTRLTKSNFSSNELFWSDEVVLLTTQIMWYKVANPFSKIFRSHDSCEKQLSSRTHEIHICTYQVRR